MERIISLIALPVLVGLLLFALPDKFRTFKGIVALLTSIVTGYLSVLIYSSGNQVLTMAEPGAVQSLTVLDGDLFRGTLKYITFNCDNLSKLIILFVSLFTFLVLLYSILYIKAGSVRNYYPYFLITLGCAYGAVLADNLLFFIACWGVLGITLYKLIRGDDEESAAAAKKTLILIGASDSIMIIGIAILWKLTGSLSMGGISVPTTSALPVIAFLALLAGSLTKAGAFPFHTWVPDYAKSAPASSSAYLPASLDKLLGIYFLARITMDLFILNQWLTLLLLSIGVITIIIAVMMALVQHNYRKLLGFHAVSQVG